LSRSPRAPLSVEHRAIMNLELRRLAARLDSRAEQDTAGTAWRATVRTHAERAARAVRVRRRERCTTVGDARLRARSSAVGAQHEPPARPEERSAYGSRTASPQASQAIVPIHGSTIHDEVQAVAVRVAAGHGKAADANGRQALVRMRTVWLSNWSALLTPHSAPHFMWDQLRVVFGTMVAPGTAMAVVRPSVSRIQPLSQKPTR
jgi:hypothetical protein